MRMLPAALAALALPLAAFARSGAPEWILLDTQPGIVVFVSDPIEGARDARRVETLIVITEPVEGLDIEITRWQVDCGAMTILDRGGVGYLGTVRVRDMPSHTPDGPVDADSGSGKRKIAAYVCDGKRESRDDARFGDSDAAIAYARKIAAQ